MENNPVLNTIESRHSYRGAYLDTPVAEEDLRAIAAAGTLTSVAGDAAGGTDGR